MLCRMLLFQNVTFKKRGLNIHKFKVIARFGLMHCLATNVCVWVRTLVRESLKEINGHYHHYDNKATVMAAAVAADAAAAIVASADHHHLKHTATATAMKSVLDDGQSSSTSSSILKAATTTVASILSSAFSNSSIIDTSSGSNSTQSAALNASLSSTSSLAPAATNIGLSQVATNVTKKAAKIIKKNLTLLSQSSALTSGEQPALLDLGKFTSHLFIIIYFCGYFITIAVN